MTPENLIAALDLPRSARLDQRVPKKLLLEQGAPAAGDKRALQAGIEDVYWVAALKPANCGVPSYRDAEREYLEIAVLTVLFRPGARVARLTELLHRAVPYPVVLVASDGAAPSLSLAQKRWSAGESGKTVLDGEIVTETLSEDSAPYMELDFLAAVAFSRQPRHSMLTLYQGWLDCLTALQVARITGRFAAPTRLAGSHAMRETLVRYSTLQREIAELTAAAEKERQIPRRVELNLATQRLRAQLAALSSVLSES